MKYYLSLAGRLFCAEAPGGLLTSPELRPFWPEAPAGMPEGEAVFIPAETIEGPGVSQCVASGRNLYPKYNGNMAYFAEEPGGRVWMCADCSGSPQKITVRYLADHAHMLRYTADLLRPMQPERLLADCGGFMLHSCIVSLPEGGILFTGPSGVGKSTQGSLWERFAGADILNGDRAGCMPAGDGWEAWGLPYAGTSGIYRNECTAVRGVVLLRQAPENTIRRMSGAEAFAKLYEQAGVHRWNASFAERVTSALIGLITRVPVWCLSCRPDEEAVKITKRAVFGENDG